MLDSVLVIPLTRPRFAWDLVCFMIYLGRWLRVPSSRPVEINVLSSVMVLSSHQWRGAGASWEVNREIFILVMITDQTSHCLLLTTDRSTATTIWLQPSKFRAVGSWIFLQFLDDSFPLFDNNKIFTFCLIFTSHRKNHSNLLYRIFVKLSSDKPAQIQIQTSCHLANHEKNKITRNK